MLTYDDTILQLSHDLESGAVIMEWTGFSSSSQFREANEAVLKLIRDTNANKIIADIRNMKIITIQDQQWLYQNWLPRTIRAGVEFVAIVESEDFFNRLSVDNVVQKIDDQLIIKYFKSVLGAKGWLKNY